MKPIKSNSRLKLNKETLRSLATEELSIVGGMSLDGKVCIPDIDIPSVPICAPNPGGSHNQVVCNGGPGSGLPCLVRP
jgi:hypothetical protein